MRLTVVRSFLSAHNSATTAVLQPKSGNVPEWLPYRIGDTPSPIAPEHVATDRPRLGSDVTARESKVGEIGGALRPQGRRDGLWAAA